MRLLRKRRKLLRRVVKVEVDQREMDALIDRSYLAAEDRNNPDAVAAAVTACFSDPLALENPLPIRSSSSWVDPMELKA
jgi:hypothetical protein